MGVLARDGVAIGQLCSENRQTTSKQQHNMQRARVHLFVIKLVPPQPKTATLRNLSLSRRRGNNHDSWGTGKKSQCSLFCCCRAVPTYEFPFPCRHTRRRRARLLSRPTLEPAPSPQKQHHTLPLIYSEEALTLRVAEVPSRKLYKTHSEQGGQYQRPVSQISAFVCVNSPVLESARDRLQVTHATSTSGVPSLGLLSPLV